MCKHPLKAFKIGYNPKTGKDILKITSYSVDHLEENEYGNWVPSFTPFVSPSARDYETEFIEIGCRKCVDCRLKYSRDWASRCMMEFAFYEPCECWFLTLTYDDDHIPVPINDKTGEIFESKVFPGTLAKDDLQKFWKRLRIYMDRKIDYDRKIRYFACGEYGSKTLRPHYHAIVYGLPWIDLEPWEKSKSGNQLFRSPILEKIWNKGIVCVSPVSWNTCAYVARYVLKKADGLSNKDYKENYAEPEFIVMSRRPGIGRDYYEQYKDKIYEFDEIILGGDKDVIKSKPPHYFDSLYEAEAPDAYANIKKGRMESAQNNKFWKMSRTDLSYLEQLQVEENQLINRLKGLYRDKI